MINHINNPEYDTLINDLCSPVFGVKTKSELELSIFTALVNNRQVDIDNIFDIITKLHINRTKATTLIYNYKLRHNNEKVINNDLTRAVLSPIKKDVRDNDDIKITFAINNPFLIDKIKSILSNKQHIADTPSFSTEIVTMSVEAYIELLKYVFDNIDDIQDKNKLNSIC